MISNFKDNITWHDVSSPTDEDLQFIQKRFNLHQVLLEEVKTPSGRQKVELYGSFIFLVLHFPMYDEKKRTCEPVEVDIVAKEHEIATIRYEEIEPLRDMQEKCVSLPDYKKFCLGETSAEFIYRLVETLIDFAQRQLRHINENVSEIEEAVFAGKEKEMIKEISIVKRDILDFRRILRPLHGTLESLERKGGKFFGEGKDVYFADLTSDYHRLWNLAETYKETIESLEATNQTLLSSRIDEVMRLVSILAFLTVPFTIIGGLFQMNTQYTPIIGKPYDWWIATALMVVGSVLLYSYFKRRGWL